MSDTSQGDGWWLASDGKWYPPEPAAAVPPPPPPPAPPVASPPPPPAAPSLPPPPPPMPPVPPPAPTPQSPVWKRPWFVVIALGVVGLLVASVVTRDDDPDELDLSTIDGLEGLEGLEIDLDFGSDAGDLSEMFDDSSMSGDDAVDFVRCDMVGDDSVELEVVNNSSETSSYFITIIFRDEAGTRLADELQTVNNLRPGERTIESSYSFDRVGTSCEAGDVDRFSAQSAADELDDANDCELTGRDSFGDLTAATSVTNDSSETSDYFLTVAFVGADGVRVGTGSASASAVAPGDTAPTDVFTFVEAEAARCDIVSVQRYASD